MVCYRLAHIRLIELIEPIEKGDIEAVKQHLAKGADVNAKRDGGITPLDDTTRENEFDVTFYGTGTEIQLS